MIKRTWLLALVLGVPLVAYAVSIGVQTHFNSELQSVLRDANLRLLEYAAFTTGLVGLALLGLIFLGGRLAQNSRIVLLQVFKPGLYLTSATLVALVLAHASLAIASIYYLATLAGRIPIGIIAAIGIGAIIGVIAVTRSVFSVVQKAKQIVIGRSIGRDEAPQLWQRVQDLAHRLKALTPDHIVLGLDPNFFVTEADVVCINGTLTGRTLYCSLPLMRILHTKEVEAVIGHELGHFKGGDTQFSEKFYPIYRGTTSAIEALQSATGQGASQSIAVLPAIAVFSYFLESFSVAESRIGRERELCADHEGASITTAETMATALVKVHAFSPPWNTLRYAAISALQGGKMFVNASKTYVEIVADCANSVSLDALAGTHLSHPTDSHPPLSVRLSALAIKMDQIAQASFDVQPNPSAIELIRNVEKLEEEISDQFQQILAWELDIDPQATAQAEYTSPQPADAFSYICPHCNSFRRSDASKCETCGDETPHVASATA